MRQRWGPDVSSVTTLLSSLMSPAICPACPSSSHHSPPATSFTILPWLRNGPEKSVLTSEFWSKYLWSIHLDKLGHGEAICVYAVDVHHQIWSSMKTEAKASLMPGTMSCHQVNGINKWLYELGLLICKTMIKEHSQSWQFKRGISKKWRSLDGCTEMTNALGLSSVGTNSKRENIDPQIA